MSQEEFLKSAQNQFDDALPFVIYRKPNTLVVKGLFQNNDTVYTSENLTENGFVFSPFNSEKKTVLIPFLESVALQSNFIDLKPEEYSNKIELETLPQTKSFHINLVEKAIQAIKSNHLTKVVISREEEFLLKESNPIQLFKRLLSHYKSAFVYCWYHPKIGLWLGATPETLLTVTGNRFTTMALAGTQKYVDNLKPVWQPKEKEEQQLVTNFIVDNLNNLVSSLKVLDVETVKAGKLLHLQTKISGTLNSNLKLVVNALHPTPAVCGLPKEKSKKFILENENYNREFYTGFLGEINNKEKTSRNTNRRNVENNVYTSIKTVTNLYVNLRCMQLTDVKAKIYVGGGITKDSVPVDEWEETVNKAQTMKKVLF